MEKVMRRFVLRAKHWQLFIIFFIGISLPFVFQNENLEIVPMFFCSTLLLSLVIFYTRSVNIGLNSKLSEDLQLNLSIFKIVNLIPVVYLVGLLLIIAWVHQNNTLVEEADIFPVTVLIFILFHFLSMVSVLLYYIFIAAKTLNTLELNKKPTVT